MVHHDFVGNEENDPSINRIRATIQQRNTLREQSGLPLLSVDAELRRLTASEDQLVFEKHFQMRRRNYENLWSRENGRGFLANMGIYSSVRRMMRDQMTKSRRR